MKTAIDHMISNLGYAADRRTWGRTIEQPNAERSHRAQYQLDGAAEKPGDPEFNHWKAAYRDLERRYNRLLLDAMAVAPVTINISMAEADQFGPVRDALIAKGWTPPPTVESPFK